MQEQNDMRGRLKLCLVDRTGQVVHQQNPKNRIVKSGRQLVAQLFAGVPGTPPTQVTEMGVGTDGTPPNDEQTNLLTPRAPRKPIGAPAYEELIENEGTDNAIKRIRTILTTEFDFGEANGADPLREAAIFNTDGIMYNRVVFEPVTKTDAFKLTLLWEIVF
ncbi:MAG: hypothetical protein F6K19_41605 [Cyanothece sp. SIO1E1]|nr:hypothetical protein [Cyanothece sp. SIO1E1]